MEMKVEGMISDIFTTGRRNSNIIVISMKDVNGSMKSVIALLEKSNS